MSSVRKLKKDVNDMVFDVVEECYSIQLFDESKTEKTDAFVEEAVAFLNSAISKINAAKTKADYRAIVAECEEKAEDWVARLNTL